MFDYYAMPENTPEIGLHDPDIYERIGKIEAAVNRDIGQANCMFHFMLHEFEGILFLIQNLLNLLRKPMWSTKYERFEKVIPP